LLQLLPSQSRRIGAKEPQLPIVERLGNILKVVLQSGILKQLNHYVFKKSVEDFSFSTISICTTCISRSLSPLVLVMLNIKTQMQASTAIQYVFVYCILSRHLQHSFVHALD
jgi:hypothetical protein